MEKQIPDVSARLVRGMRKMAPIMTETYAAYGATDVLFKECARHGDYTIPQAKEKGGVIPTNEEGTHIGVGSGWWYESECISPIFYTLVVFASYNAVSLLF